MRVVPPLFPITATLPKNEQFVLGMPPKSNKEELPSPPPPPPPMNVDTLNWDLMIIIQTHNYTEAFFTGFNKTVLLFHVLCWCVCVCVCVGGGGGWFIPPQGFYLLQCSELILAKQIKLLLRLQHAEHTLVLL